MGKHLQLCGRAHFRATRTNIERRNTFFFRFRKTTVLGVFKDSVIILDAILRLYSIKSAAMFTSVGVDFGRPPHPSCSTSSLPARNHEYHLIFFYITWTMHFYMVNEIATNAKYKKWKSQYNATIVYCCSNPKITLKIIHWNVLHVSTPMESSSG
jgi:hypothetical protein